MTNCLTPQQIEAFFDKELSGEQLQVIQDHITGCDACRVELESLQQVNTQVVAAHRSITPRAGWLDEMESILKVESAARNSERLKQSGRIRRFVGFATAASLLVAAFLVIQRFSSSDSGPAILAERDSSGSNATNMPQFADQVPKAEDRERSSRSPAVIAQGDFLVGRHPESDDDIEIYWVLPIVNKR